MSETLIDKLTKTPEGMRLYQQERAIQELTDLMCQMIEEEGITRAELARRLGRTKGYVTQLLDGRANMTIRTISDVLHALNRAVHFQDGPLGITVSPSPVLRMSKGLAWSRDNLEWPEGVIETEPQSPIPGTLAV